jgi:hypothetical protein
VLSCLVVWRKNKDLFIYLFIKFSPKTDCGSENFSDSQHLHVHLRKSTNESKGKVEQKFDAAFRTIFILRKCFKRSKPNFEIIFLFCKAGESLKDPDPRQRSMVNFG